MKSRRSKSHVVLQRSKHSEYAGESLAGSISNCKDCGVLSIGGVEEMCGILGGISRQICNNERGRMKELGRFEGI